MLPAEGVFDLLRRAFIFFGEVGYGFASAETGRDYSSGNSGSGKYRLAKSNEGIDFDGLWFGGDSLPDEREEPERTSWIGYDALEVQAVKIQAELIGRLGDVDDLAHPLDKQVFAVGQKNFVHERMRLRELFSDSAQSGANLGKTEIIDFAHAGESMAFKQIEERKANRV